MVALARIIAMRRWIGKAGDFRWARQTAAYDQEDRCCDEESGSMIPKVHHTYVFFLCRRILFSDRGSNCQLVKYAYR